MTGSIKHTNPNLYAYWLGFEPVVLYYDRRKRRHGHSRFTIQRK